MVYGKSYWSETHIQSIASLLKESNYEVVLVGKVMLSQIVYLIGLIISKVNNRYLPLEKVDDYLQNAKPFA